VEWSRIQPVPDRWDEDALEHYRSILRGLRDRNMTAMVTLHHFTDPLWLAELGSWETEAAVPLFEKFVRKTVEALKEYCTLWCTINEPNVYALEAYVDKKFPPGRSDLRLAMRVEATCCAGMLPPTGPSMQSNRKRGSALPTITARWCRATLGSHWMYWSEISTIVRLIWLSRAAS